MALPPSTANWHWRSKDVTPWARSWFENQLVGSVICSEGETLVAKIDTLKTFEGDAEVGMRKSKLLTIYDLKVECIWSGKAADGTAVEGTVTLPEVSHEVGADGDGDYEASARTSFRNASLNPFLPVNQFRTTVTTGGSSANSLHRLVQKHLPAFLQSKLNPFPAAMLEAHGKDVKVEGTPAASGATTPVGPPGVNSTVPSVDAAGKLNVPKPAKVPKSMNTSTVKVESTFAASASDLFDLLTDEQRITMWSRAAAKSKPIEGSEYSIFGGNINGKFVSLEQPGKIVQSWALKSPSWPDNHFATLTTTLTQGSDSTNVVFALSGVPTGQEDEIRNNLNGYYVRGFQSIGYVALSPDLNPSELSSSSQPNPPPTPPSLSSRVIVFSIVASVLVAAIGSRFL
ncbi:hypothetical protein FRB99_005169 [Tulasnella sp. 403]|nr:hypothetical protein FRB99_005169 [Tulasnella sp. 403]